MKNDGNYFKERNHRILDDLRRELKALPYICNEFFIGIENTTQPLTRLGYATDLRVFFHFLTTEIEIFTEKPLKNFDYADLARVSVTHIEMYLSYLSHYAYHGKEFSNTLKTKCRKLSSVKAFFKYNYNKDNIPADPAAKIPTPKLKETAIIRMEKEEMRDFLEEVDSGRSLTPRQAAYHERTRVRDNAITTLFLGTGIRISELVGLNVDDLDFRINGFRVTRKGGGQTILYFSREVADALLAYLDERAQNPLADDAPALFLSLQNKRLCVRAVENIVKKYAKSAVPLKNITPHKLRSTYGTNLYRETGDIYVVAEVLGHKDINTTKKHYAAISEDIKKNAASKVRLRDD